MQILQQQNKQFRLGEIAKDEKISSLEQLNGSNLKVIDTLRQQHCETVKTTEIHENRNMSLKTDFEALKKDVQSVVIKQQMIPEKESRRNSITLDFTLADLSAVGNTTVSKEKDDDADTIVLDESIMRRLQGDNDYADVDYEGNNKLTRSEIKDLNV